MGISFHLRTESLNHAHGFVRYWGEIAALREELGADDDVLLDPLHFLAGTADNRRPRCVLGWNGIKLIGLMYVTEQYFSGFGCGYAVGGDYAGRGLLLCHPEHEAAVVQASIEHLTHNGIHSLHLRLSPRDNAKAEAEGMRIVFLDAVIPGDRLALLGSFDEFLATLGRHTRRNVRHYIRKAEQVGIEFTAALTPQEYQTAVARLRGIAAFRADPLRLARDERFLALHSGSHQMGLRARDGTLVAVLCGFVRGSRFHLLTQLNDVTLSSLSLSVALRGHTAKYLIASGISELQFMGGTSLSFGRFCPPQPYRSIFVDRRRGIYAVAKHIAGELAKLTTVLGAHVPENLQLICNGHLDEAGRVARTAVGPAEVAFGRERRTSGPQKKTGHPGFSEP